MVVLVGFVKEFAYHGGENKFAVRMVELFVVNLVGRTHVSTLQLENIFVASLVFVDFR